ncbi:hypothetical protein [Natrinema salaciae]|uniref:Uncharacterized protein n=1 Tax=Natrinema salaciae TaxID=1186196 RepID=A0A1H9CBU7_9EURY|nr:hypothetical protein [Natrinema salaciae]SEP98263.1 hypothetical protein SAMN04489841_0999 [Natrinema salaciae]
MTTGYVVNLDNGHNGDCVESLLDVTYYGETFDPEAANRELRAVDRSHDHPHNTLCFDCSMADSRKVRGAVRGELTG